MESYVAVLFIAERQDANVNRRWRRRLERTDHQFGTAIHRPETPGCADGAYRLSKRGARTVRAFLRKEFVYALLLIGLSVTS